MQFYLPYRCKIVLLFLCTLGPTVITAQETVFNSLGSNLKRADKYYNNQSYEKALNLYLEVEKKGKAQNQLYLKLAHTCHHLYQPDQSVIWFERFLEVGEPLGSADLLVYAESLISTGRYSEAITQLEKYQTYDPQDGDIVKKIWRLQNIQHLYTDSAYYEVKPLAINTDFAEFGPAYDDQQLIFVSNRGEKRGISKIDPVTGQSFQSLYQTNYAYDSIDQRLSFGKPTMICKEQNKGLHLGPVSVVGDMMIFTRSTMDRSTMRSNLKLYWTRKIDGKWVGEEPFQHNNNLYSLSHPSLSHDGNTLYFVSDMPGGIGGTDIYRCFRGADGWTQPQNLGKTINTKGDETTPFIHEDKVLYFASSGHGGFGGLDVFKVMIDEMDIGQVENLGYPVNTSSDDFGLILNKQGVHGFLSSNRRSGGFNDDLYEVTVDLQQYPLVITGHLRYHDPDWSQTSRLEVLANAKLTLVDHKRGMPVYETTTGPSGDFLLEIPYSSQYRLKVSSEKVGEPSVSLEIPKNRKLHTDHEIVVVKEKFTQAVTGSNQRKKK